MLLKSTSGKLLTFSNTYLLSKNLPDEYQAVEYIASTNGGKQYIDSEIKPELTAEINANIQWLTVTANGYFGSYNPRNYFGFWYQKGTLLYYNGTGGCISEFPVLNTIYNYRCSMQGTTFNFYINNVVKYSRTATPKFCTNTYYIFARNNGGSAGTHAWARVYGTYYIDGHPFVACYRKSDHKPGMYDILTGKFHTNKGTGADFIVGPDIN